MPTSVPDTFPRMKLQGLLRSERDLAAENSKFLSVNGVEVHYIAEHPPIVASQPPQQRIGIHCYHGFGAGLYSWSFVQRLLAQRLQAIVTSHDTPGFGLTSRSAHATYIPCVQGLVCRTFLRLSMNALSPAVRNVVGDPDLTASCRAPGACPSSTTRSPGAGTRARRCCRGSWKPAPGQAPRLPSAC